MPDAVNIKPKFIPDGSLLGRDDSGGYNYQPYTAEWGDGGQVAGGSKGHLSVSGGHEPKDASNNTEQDSTLAARNSNKGGGAKK